MSDQATNLMTLAAQNATTPNDITAMVLSIVTTGTPEQVAQVRDRVKWLGQQARELSKLFDGVLIERLEAAGQTEIVLSPTCRLYLGNPPKYTIRPGKAGELVGTVMQLAGGDMDAVSEQFLASGWFKAGAIRAAIEATDAPASAKFDDLILTTRETSVEEGKPKKLLESNPDFNRGRRKAVLS